MRAVSSTSELGGRLLVALTTWALPRMIFYSFTGLPLYGAAHAVGVVPVLNRKDLDWMQLLDQWTLRTLPVVFVIVSIVLMPGGYLGFVFFIFTFPLLLIVNLTPLWWKREVANGRSGEPPTPTAFFVERVRRGRRRGVQRGWISRKTAYSPLAAWPAARAEYRELLRGHGL